MKLHEVLGAQSAAFTQAESQRKDLENTFEKKRTHFTEKVVTFVPNEEGKQPEVEEQLKLQTTVRDELSWISALMLRALDSEATIDEGNMVARGDVILDDGTTLLEKVPATQLMQLEKRLNELLEFCRKIPTLDPTKGFEQDPQRKIGIFKSREEVRPRGRKEQKPIVLYPATEQHPAQTQLITQDVEIGKVRTIEWSGMLTPAEKGDIMDRVEELRRAVKMARGRANDVEIQKIQIGRKLLTYVFGVEPHEKGSATTEVAKKRV